MGFPYIIPTIDEPMSSYTAMVFGFLLAAVPVAWCFGYNWIKKEFKRVDESVDHHSEFVKATSDTMVKLQTDIAVMNGTLSSQAADMHEIKDSMDGINKTMWTQFVK
jgi:hypothetical protein